MKFFSRSEWRDGCNICTCDSGRVDCSPMPCQCSEPGVDPGCCPECQAGATCPHQVELRMLSHFFTTEFFSCQPMWGFGGTAACNVCSCSGNCWSDLCTRPEVDTQLHGVRMPGEPIQPSKSWSMLGPSTHLRLDRQPKINWNKHIVPEIATKKRLILCYKLWISNWINPSILWRAFHLCRLEWQSVQILDCG